MKRNYQKNITKMYTFNGIVAFGITGMWMVYLQYRGLSLAEIGLIEGLFSAASFVFEIPSGMMADRFSYKQNLYFSRLCGIASALCMLYSSSFIGYAGGFILSAASYSLISGTTDAFVYESLKAVNEEERFIKITSVTSVIYELSNSLGVILASLLIHRYFEGVYWIQICGMLLAAGLVYGMEEPPTKQQQGGLSLKEIIGAAYQLLRNNTRLFGYMLFDGVYAACLMIFYYYFQSTFLEGGFSGLMIGLIMGISIAFQLAGAYLATRIRRSFVRVIQLLLAVTSGAFLLVGLQLEMIYVMVFWGATFILAFTTPLFMTYYNQQIESEVRATLLSVAQMFYSLTMAVFFPLYGFVIQVSSFSMVFAGTGVLLLMLTGIFYWKNR